MWLPEPYGQEKRLGLFTQLAQCLDSEFGDSPVKIGFVWNVSLFALLILSQARRQRPVHDRLVVAVICVVHERWHAPRIRVPLNRLPKIVEDFADVLREVAV